MSNYTLNCIHYQVCQRSTCNTKCQYFEEKPKLTGDLISRSVLKEKVALMWGDNSHVTESMYEIIDNTSIVKRTTGYWIDTGIVNWEGFVDFECSNCHKCDTREETDKYVPFCKYCGAAMEVKKNE